MAFTPYNPDEAVHRHRLHLPHWRQWGRSYFITTRLADSLPSHVRERWIQQRNNWLAGHGLPSDAVPEQLAEAFDHIVRSEAQWEHFRRYIADNPAKAGLHDGYVLGCGDRAGLTREELLGEWSSGL